MVADSARTLTDGTITLRPPTEADSTRSTGLPGPRDPALDGRPVAVSPRGRGRVPRASATQERAEGRTFNFLAVDDDDRILGSFGLMELDKAPRYGEIGYWVAKDARGQGRRDACGRAAARLGRERARARAGRAADPRGQRAVAARRRAHRLPGHRRAPPAPRAGGTPAALDHAVYAWSARVELERARGRSRPSRTRPRRRATRGHARQPRRVAEQRGAARWRARRGRRAATSSAPVAISGKPPTRGQQQRLAERQRGEQHAGLVDLAVGQHDQVGRAEGARELGVRTRSAAPCARPGRG